MKRLTFIAVILCSTVSVFAKDKVVSDKDPLTELDTKVTRQLGEEKWDNASKMFLLNLWEDYRKAFGNPTPPNRSRSIAGKSPRVKSYDEYLGAYKRDRKSPAPFFEITKDDAGRFYVKLEKHVIPAVLRNQMVVFTTGDVVYSSTPQLGKKPYCTLEIFMIVRSKDGNFYFCSPRTTRDNWGPPLVKVEKAKD